MRMPLNEFLTSGDLKFIIVLAIFLGLSIYYFFKKIGDKQNETSYNKKINKIAVWSLLVSLFSLMLGLLHSFYFISKTNGIASNLLFAGLANVLVTPILGLVTAMVIKVLSTPFKLK